MRSVSDPPDGTLMPAPAPFALFHRARDSRPPPRHPLGYPRATSTTSIAQMDDFAGRMCPCPVIASTHVDSNPRGAVLRRTLSHKRRRS